MPGNNPYEPPAANDDPAAPQDNSHAWLAFRIWQGASILGTALPVWGCCCVFQPSWAKGWPGLSFPAVFGGSFAMVAFLAIVALGGCVSFPFTQSRRPAQISWKAFWTFFLPTALAAAAFAAVAFFLIYLQPHFWGPQFR
jgi:hypothetical protein